MISKALQKSLYDVLSWKPFGPLFVLLFCFLSISTVLYCIELMFHQLVGRDELTVLLTDNIDRSRLLQNTDLMSPLPIDAVFTWVNGSDERLLEELRLIQATLDKQPARDVTKCALSNCVPTNEYLALSPALNNSVSLSSLRKTYGSVQIVYASTTIGNAQYSVLRVANAEFVIDNSTVSIDSSLFTQYRVFLTTQLSVDSITFLHNTVFVFGVSPEYVRLDSMNRTSLRLNLPHKYQSHVVDMRFVEQLSALQLTFDEQSVQTDFIEDRNVTLGTLNSESASQNANAAKNLVVMPVFLAWNLHSETADSSDSISASRFRDNEELRYALRSLEMYAGWFRRIYLVTNGQIPYWLNLENDRIRVVTHREIFGDDVDILPVFSSSAIEAHLQNVQGLSDPFVYLNDDMMFGRTVRPEDFYSTVRGQRVYLTWPVPHCRDGCPSSWLNDGYCDKACNFSECDFDGGDCAKNATRPAIFAAPNNNANVQSVFGVNQFNTFCSPGCANTWISDRFCDNACNKRDCAFDGGDCGSENFHQIYRPTESQIRMLSRDPASLDVQLEVHVQLPWDAFAFYVYLGDLFDAANANTYANYSVSNAEYELHHAVRLITIAQQLSTMHVLLANRNFSSTIIDVKLISAAYNLTLAVRFRVENATEIKQVSKLSFPTPPTSLADYDAPVVLSRQLKMPDAVRVRLERLFDFIMSNASESEVVEADRRLVEQHSALVSLARNNRLLKNGFIRRMAEFLNVSNVSLNVNTAQKPGDVGPSVIRKVLAVRQPFHSFLPWENLHVLHHAQPDSTDSSLRFGRSLLSNSYGDSLKHVNSLYNRHYGYAARKVPGHMPHFIQRNVLLEMHERFSEQWAYTRRQKVRSGRDMQFAFAYFYYLMSETRNVTVKEVLDSLDSNLDGLLNANELHTLLSRIHGAPVKSQQVSDLRNALVLCGYRNASVDDGHSELWSDSHSETDRTMLLLNQLIPVEIASVTECESIGNHLAKLTSQRVPRFLFEPLNGDDDVWFRMLVANATNVQHILDDVRAKPKRFLCLNDDIDVTRSSMQEVEKVRTLLHDFLESQYPFPSQFELENGKRNDCLYIDQCRQLGRVQFACRVLGYSLIVLLLLYFCFFRLRLKQLRPFAFLYYPKLWTRRKRVSSYDV